jgi:peptidylprolyl isomerase
MTLLVCVSLIGSYTAGSAKAEGGPVVIENGKKVTFNYTLTVDNEVVDDSEKRGPLTYVHGEGKIIPGLAKRMTGMQIGEERNIEVPPEEAYGVTNPEAVREIPKTSLPDTIELQAGVMLQMQTPEGQPVPVTISEVKEDTVVLDLNHPLAGKILVFHIAVISIE